MENASKALIMAASILLGVAIISIGVYLFVNFGSVARDANKEVEQQQLEKENSKYTSYVGKAGLTIYDVITVANMARENNLSYGYKETDHTDSINNSYVEVVIVTNSRSITGTNVELKTENDLNDKLNREMQDMQSNNHELHNYKCLNTLISDKTLRVYKVIFIRDDEAKWEFL